MRGTTCEVYRMCGVPHVRGTRVDVWFIFLIILVSAVSQLCTPRGGPCVRNGQPWRRYVCTLLSELLHSNDMKSLKGFF